MGASKLPGIFFKPFTRAFLITILFIFFIFLPNPLRADSAMYGIQIDEYKDPKGAEDRVNSLKQLGHDAFYRCETTESGEMTCRVFVDQFETRTEAEEEAAFLKKLDLIEDFAIFVIIDKPPEKKPATKPPPVSPSKNPSDKYYIQVGSFRIKINADSLIHRLEKAGYKASMKYEAVNGKGNYYRVYISGYASDKDAQNAAQALKKSGIISGYVIKAGDEPSFPSPQIPVDITMRDNFFLHIGSYQDLNNAEKIVEAIQGQGHKAFFIIEELSDGIWFRVYAGGLESENAARRLGTELQEKGLISYYTIIGIK
ncbi:MAG: SPOR domain-containing protein [Deltaproteobacteria bacterium]|nr:SPOR domain-containing protein [Deltaproteobacteria bacterium]